MVRHNGYQTKNGLTLYKISNEEFKINKRERTVGIELSTTQNGSFGWENVPYRLRQC